MAAHTAAAELTIAALTFAAAPGVLASMSAAAALSVAPITLTATPRVYSPRQSATLAVGAITINASPVITSAGGGLIVRDVLSDVFNLWGLCCSVSDTCIQQEAVNVVNAAMQFLHSKGKELPFLTKRTHYCFFAAGETSAAMDSTVQNVDGYVRVYSPPTLRIICAYSEGSIYPFSPIGPEDPGLTLFSVGGGSTSFNGITTTAGLAAEIAGVIDNDAVCWVTEMDYDDGPDDIRILRIYFSVLPLMSGGLLESWQIANSGDPFYSASVSSSATGAPVSPVRSRAEYDQYSAIYGSTAPLAYYLDRSHESAADSASCVMRITPAQDDDIMLAVDVEIEPARISWADFRSGTAIPIPHRYVESLLLPIVRYRAAASHRYRAKDRQSIIMQQYQDALAMLGVVDPQTSAVADNREAKSAP